MITPELLQYIRGQLAAGVSEDSIVSALVAGGWPPGDVRAALQQLAPEPPARSVPAVPASAAYAAPSSIPSVQPIGDNFAAFGMAFQARFPLSPRKFWKKC